MARAYHLGEARDADAGDLPLLASLLDVLAQLGVAELVEGDVHRLVVVAAVVDPAGGRVIRELLLANEVLLAELGLVHADLDRGVGDQALDGVARLGDAERAAIRNAAGRLVRVVAVRGDVRGRDVVRAGDYVEQAGLELARLRVREERAVV